jgi:Leu/Phe-tRNA-protein transferase
MQLRYTISGYLFISPEDDCHAIVDAMLLTNYNEEFCVAQDFSPDFVSKLMEAGFLVMSMKLEEETEEIEETEDETEETEETEDENDEPTSATQPFYILLPKLHLERSALFFKNLHVKKSIRRYLNRYELRADAEFDRILDRCVEKHGGDWLTPPLVECIKKIRQSASNHQSSESPAPGINPQPLEPRPYVYPTSFALYRDGELVAGEFGVVYDNVYTSYSGYYDEDNAGTVQLILTTRYLQEHGFSFFDMGMPLDYKTDMGAIDITPEEFVRLFRG